MRISDMANRIQPSLTRKLFDMAKQYDDVIDFTLGDPDYETPDYIKKAGGYSRWKNKIFCECWAARIKKCDFR